MPIFVFFVFAAIVFGAGAMLSPALPTYGPRIGLAGALTLAFITAGAIFMAALFGWDPLLIDYMWFAAIVGIFFTGTLSAGMFRSESEGGTREYAGWPGPRELAFLFVVGIVFLVPALILPVPPDTDAQGFGYLGLVLRDSGSLTTLAPFHPEVNYLYSPGFPALVAYLGARLNAGLHTIQFAAGAVLSILFVWVAYDFGNELDPGESRRTGVAFGVAAFLSAGLITAYLDSHYTALMALVFALAFLTFVMRFKREGRRADLWGAAICLAGVPLAQPDMTIILILGYVPWLITMWLAKPRPTPAIWFGLAVVVPGLALIGLLPWIVRIAPLLGTEIGSPFAVSTNHLLVMIVYHGGPLLLLALGGILLALRRRNALDLLMLMWLVLIADASSLGILKALFGWLPVYKYDYPFSVAWHGPIIPYLYFTAQFFLWAGDRIGRAVVERWLTGLSLTILTVTGGLATLSVVYADPLLAWTKTTPFMMYGAFSSAADVRVMTWLRLNTPQDTLILNHPAVNEGEWVPVVTARESVYFRPQPFFSNTGQVEARQAALRAFWENPTAPENEALLRRYGVDYVVVPQVFGDPAQLESMWRWRPPLEPGGDVNALASLPYLEQIIDIDGAQLYRVR